MAKKTLSVAKLVKKYNDVLLQSTCTAQERQGMIYVVESVLFETDNYKGFRYLSKDEVPGGCVPGIHFDEKGEPIFVDTDSTRRKYYIED